MPGLGVKTRCGFIEDQQLGFVDKRPGDRETALHAAGQFWDSHVPLIFELDHFQESIDPLFDLGPTESKILRVDTQVFCHREVGIQVIGLRHDTRTGSDLARVGSNVPVKDF